MRKDGLPTLKELNMVAIPSNYDLDTVKPDEFGAFDLAQEITQGYVNFLPEFDKGGELHSYLFFGLRADEISAMWYRWYSLSLRTSTQLTGVMKPPVQLVAYVPEFPNRETLPSHFKCLIMKGEGGEIRKYKLLYRRGKYYYPVEIRLEKRE